jgi:hypothetical protein
MTRIKVSDFKKNYKPKRKNNNHEDKVTNAVCTFIRAKYPKVVFYTDVIGMKLPPYLASKLSNQRSDDKIPDLFIAAPRGKYHGLFIEIKKDKEAIYRKDGHTFKKNKHVEAQLATLLKLREQGYYAVFGCGVDECMKIIDKYMKL